MTPNKLILFPGWGFCPTIMQNLADSLSKHYQTSIADLSEPFDILCSRIPENATLLGWSLGGLFSLKIASVMPIKKVILTASNPCFIAQNEWPGMDAEFFNNFSNELKENHENALQKFAYMQVQGLPDEKGAYKQLKHFLSKITATPHLLNMLKHDSRPLLSKIQCELQVILGSLDPLVPISLADKIKALKPEAHISILEDAGHASVLFNIEAIVNHVS
jgi:pimeloyl-[acyl-carrier protein] methyl ester esterase